MKVRITEPRNSASAAISKPTNNSSLAVEAVRWEGVTE
jgi:hypothetical protein